MKRPMTKNGDIEKPPLSQKTESKKKLCLREFITLCIYISK